MNLQEWEYGADKNRSHGNRSLGRKKRTERYVRLARLSLQAVVRFMYLGVQYKVLTMTRESDVAPAPVGRESVRAMFNVVETR